ncbi:transmembrane protein 242-like [Stylophora pistillata]|uniref:Transmembrane protein 242 n=1 Tax=Stylophora pistillata TaxID=50429 RepID=A0A2B4SZ46_STYPI|nr:transmembrane protein 242-like [Stylophora pistillata]PFX34576.1 Transmembrane protein 242 [Stylophora pistillata]
MADEYAEKIHENDASQNVKSTDVLAGALLLSGVTFASMAGGFGYAIGQARRRSPSSFDQRQQEGAKLAMRALGWGTVIAVSGVGLLIFGVKTALGVKDTKEFGLKMKSIFPTKDGKLVSYFEPWRIPRNKGKGNSEEWWSSETHNATEERR